MWKSGEVGMIQIDMPMPYNRKEKNMGKQFEINEERIARAEKED